MNWILIGLTFYLNVTALAINPQTPDTLYAGTDGGGVFKSTDGGTNWTAMNNGLTNPAINALAINPQTPDTLYAGVNAYGGGVGVFESTNGGTNWTANGLPNTVVHALAIDPMNPSILYAGTAGTRCNGVFEIEQETCPTPGVVSDPSPSNQAANVSTNPTLSWTSSANTNSYDVYFGTSSNPPYVGNTTSTSYASPGLSNSTTYYWKIVAKNSCGNSTPGPVWSFSTVQLSTYSLTVTKLGTGSGTVTSSPAGINCGTYCVVTTEFDIKPGKKITLKAKADSNSIFKGWSGDGCSGTGRCVVVMNADTAVTAAFSTKVPAISVSPSSLDFGNVKVGKKAIKTLKIANGGAGNLVITLSGLDGTDFSFQGISSVTVKANGSYSLRILFLPESAGLQTGTLEINSNAPNTPILDIPLSGTGQ